VNEQKKKPGGTERDFSEFAHRRPPDEPEKGGRVLRGCGMALGIALLILAFVVGTCFVKMS
jgi:hypothetical protein